MKVLLYPAILVSMMLSKLCIVNSFRASRRTAQGHRVATFSESKARVCSTAVSESTPSTASEGAGSKALENLKSMKLNELKELLKKLGGKPSGLRKSELVDACSALMKEKYDSYKSQQTIQSDESARKAFVDDNTSVNKVSESTVDLVGGRNARGYEEQRNSAGQSQPPRRNTVGMMSMRGEGSYSNGHSYNLAAQKIPVGLDFKIVDSGVNSNSESSSAPRGSENKTSTPTSTSTSRRRYVFPTGSR
jgi:hypothetical protein